MARIIYAVGISLDGYIARPDGNVDFLFIPEDYSFETLMNRLGAVIMGRKTYEACLQMGATYEEGKTRTYVVSRSLNSGERDGVTFLSGDAAGIASRVRSETGRDIWLMGGGDLARQFLQSDLIDEIQLGVVPVAIGEGIPAFPAGFPQRDFELTSCERYSRGLAALSWRRNR